MQRVDIPDDRLLVSPFSTAACTKKGIPQARGHPCSFLVNSIMNQYCYGSISHDWRASAYPTPETWATQVMHPCCSCWLPGMWRYAHGAGHGDGFQLLKGCLTISPNIICWLETSELTMNFFTNFSPRCSSIWQHNPWTSIYLDTGWGFLRTGYCWSLSSLQSFSELLTWHIERNVERRLYVYVQVLTR